MTVLNKILTPVQRHISDMEQRIARQSALIDQLAGAGQDTRQATRTLQILSATLALSREHLGILMSVASRRKPSGELAADPAG